MKKKISSKSIRKSPRQDRAMVKVNLILEAASRILETSGYSAFNTNSVSELAGVSPGTLYQYFPNKQAIIFSLVVRQLKETAMAARVATENLPSNQILEAFIDSTVSIAQQRPRLTVILIASEPMMLLTKSSDEISISIKELMIDVLVRIGVQEEFLDAAAVDVAGIIKGMVLASAGNFGLLDSGLSKRIAACVRAYLSTLNMC